MRIEFASTDQAERVQREALAALKRYKLLPEPMEDPGYEAFRDDQKGR